MSASDYDYSSVWLLGAILEGAGKEVFLLYLLLVDFMICLSEF